MIGALLLGLFCGIVARILVPGDVFRNMSGPMSWLVSIGLGLLGALVGYLIFTVGLGIGDTDIFDWGGVLLKPPPRRLSGTRPAGWRRAVRPAAAGGTG